MYTCDRSVGDAGRPLRVSFSVVVVAVVVVVVLGATAVDEVGDAPDSTSRVTSNLPSASTTTTAKLCGGAINVEMKWYRNGRYRPPTETSGDGADCVARWCRCISADRSGMGMSGWCACAFWW